MAEAVINHINIPFDPTSAADVPATLCQKVITVLAEAVFTVWRCRATAKGHRRHCAEVADNHTDSHAFRNRLDTRVINYISFIPRTPRRGAICKGCAPPVRHAPFCLALWTDSFVSVVSTPTISSRRMSPRKRVYCLVLVPCFYLFTKRILSGIPRELESFRKVSFTLSHHPRPTILNNVQIRLLGKFRIRLNQCLVSIPQSTSLTY